jgi:hypothetical protein
MMMLVGMMTMTATSTKTMAVTLMVVQVAVEKMYMSWTIALPMMALILLMMVVVHGNADDDEREAGGDDDDDGGDVDDVDDDDADDADDDDADDVCQTFELALGCAWCERSSTSRPERCDLAALTCRESVSPRSPNAAPDAKHVRQSLAILTLYCTCHELSISYSSPSIVATKNARNRNAPRIPRRFRA